MASEEEDEEQCGFWASFSGSKSARSYKWVSTVFVMVFLVVGGFVAWITMKSAANKLGGDGNYNSLSANNTVGGDTAARAEKEDFFASEEELANADPALRKELLYDSAGAAGHPSAAGAERPVSGPVARAVSAEGGSFSSAPGGSVTRPPALRSALADRLLVRAGNFGQSRDGQTSKVTELRPEETNSNISLRPVQSKSGAAAGVVARGQKTSVMDALKSTFKANLHGARLASQDATRVWIAKAFDANHDAGYSLEYNEKMKAKLDRLNPDSIPKFLREQNISATGAKSLGVSEVGKPELDIEGTREALKNDKDYQDKKSGQDLAKALFTPLGPLFGLGGSGDASPTGRTVPPADAGTNPSYSDPATEQTLNNIALNDYVATNGYGEDCGCAPEAPCCCLPPNSLNKQCPEYGPFLADDPCAPEELYRRQTGDFPEPPGLVPMMEYV